MKKKSKRMQKIIEKINYQQLYSIEQAIQLVKECAVARFDESIDTSVQLGIDTKKSDQVVRGSVILPAGTGRSVRVAVFANLEKAEQAKAAHADIVGMEDLAEQIKLGKINFDVLIATPDAMRIVGTLGQILGPRGLMPNPKIGTVTSDISNAVKNAKTGQIQFRAEKAGIIHTSIGRASFDSLSLKNNLTVLLTSIRKAKPITSKDIYFKKLFISSTMGIGVRVDQTSLSF